MSTVTAPAGWIGQTAQVTRRWTVDGIRQPWGLGVAIIGTLLAETKLSNRGVGYLIIQAYSTFDMPRMYALLIVLFTLSIGANALLGRLARSGPGEPAPADGRMPVQ